MISSYLHSFWCIGMPSIYTMHENCISVFDSIITTNLTNIMCFINRFIISFLIYNCICFLTCYSVMMYRFCYSVMMHCFCNWNIIVMLMFISFRWRWRTASSIVIRWTRTVPCWWFTSTTIRRWFCCAFTWWTVYCSFIWNRWRRGYCISFGNLITCFFVTTVFLFPFSSVTTSVTATSPSETAGASTTLTFNFFEALFLYLSRIDTFRS